MSYSQSEYQPVVTKGVTVGGYKFEIRGDIPQDLANTISILHAETILKKTKADSETR